MVRIGLYRPNDDQLHAAAEEFGLHPLAVEDAIDAHQRPKLERYGNTLFVVLRAAYGMNFDHMPEPSWAFGYLFALGLMLLTCVGLYTVFKGRNGL
ncbi:Mg2+ and Co2+ transporter CorA [Mycobacteroides chelonae]|nr:Mg2+ and Co2+ transporter CorA [Mycobacteroides chelonae]